MLKTLFLGNPALAVPFLARLHDKSKVVSVITSPDQPAGRGYELKEPAVKTAAKSLSLPIWQPEKLKDPAVSEQFKALGADVGIVVAYGKLIPKAILDIPKHGFINVHFSLLPKYRGAAPMQWALVNGERETGVSLFWLDEGMDTGPIFIQKKLAITDQDDSASLKNKLVALGVEALEESLARIGSGKIDRIPQTGSGSMAPLLKKENGLIDWSKPAQTIMNQIRGLTPWPGVYMLGLKVLKAKVVEAGGKGESGSVITLVTGEGPVVKCGSDALLLLEIQPDGKKAMNAWSWWQGARLKVGEKLR